jgi:hypothetical protein
MIAAAITFGVLTLLPANFSYTWFARLLLADGLAMGLFAAPNTVGTMTAVLTSCLRGPRRLLVWPGSREPDKESKEVMDASSQGRAPNMTEWSVAHRDN